MPRELMTECNVMEFEDAISGDILTIYYRLPDNDERVGYSMAFFDRDAENVVAKSQFQVRLEYGAKICTGFETGDFTVGGKPIASDPNDPAFYPEWPKLMRKAAGDVLAMLAYNVFGGLVPKRKEVIQVIENLAKPAPAEEGDKPAEEAAPDPLS